MTESNRQPDFEDAPTAPTEHVYPPNLTPDPPRGPQTAPPPAWQPAGWSGSQSAQPISWKPAGGTVETKRAARGRWIVALLGALVIVAGGIGIAVFALGAKNSTAVGPSFVPASAPLYLEVRLDLPGTQRDNVVKLASHFPGFADQSAFDLKIDQTFDKLVGNASSSSISYTRDIKPWFGGQVAIGVLQVPAAIGQAGASMLEGTASPEAAMPGGSISTLAHSHVVMGLSVKDRSRLDTLLALVRSMATNTKFSEEQYNGHNLVSVSGSDSPLGAYNVSDSLLLIASNSADLKSSLDVLDGKAAALSADAGFLDAMKALPADRLGAVYTGSGLYQAAADGIRKLGDEGGNSPMAAYAGAARCMQPAVGDPASARSAAAIVANGDSVSLESRSTGLTSQPTQTSTDLAAHMPADALFYAELPKAGGSLHDIVACLRAAMPDAFTGQQVKQIESLLGTPLEDYLAFVTDVGLGISWQDGRFHWGLVAGVNSEDIAKSRITSLLSYARLAASASGAPLTVSEQQVAGTAVSTIALSGGPDLGALPVDPSISVAVSSGHLYLGGGDFAASALSRTAADSLQSNGRYSTALTAAGNPNGMVFYVDMDGIRQRAETVATPNQDYTTNVQPYLKPFDRLIISANQEGGTTVGRLLLFVK